MLFAPCGLTIPDAYAPGGAARYSLANTFGAAALQRALAARPCVSPGEACIAVSLEFIAIREPYPGRSHDQG